MNFKIINTEKSDLEFIYSLFDSAIEYQKRKGYPVWNSYDKIVLQKDIEQRLQYKIVWNDNILCVFSICYSDKIIWREKEQGNAMYLHRIVVNPEFKGQKQFEKVLEWSIEEAKKKGLEYIRMDTWDNNPSIVDYYKSFGFQFVEHFTTPNTTDLPIQHRNLGLTLLEYKID